MKQVQPKNRERIGGERFVIVSEHLVGNWGEKQGFCFEELTDASWKWRTVCSSHHPHWHLAVSVCWNSVVFQREKWPGQWALLLERHLASGAWMWQPGGACSFVPGERFFPLVPGYTEPILCLTVKTKVLLWLTQVHLLRPI